MGGGRGFRCVCSYYTWKWKWTGFSASSLKEDGLCWRLFAWKFKGVGFTESGLNLVKFMASSLNEGSKQLGVPLHGHSNGQVSVQVVVGDSLARKFKETGFRVSSLAKGVVHSWGSLYMEI